MNWSKLNGCSNSKPSNSILQEAIAVEVPDERDKGYHSRAGTQPAEGHDDNRNKESSGKEQGKSIYKTNGEWKLPSNMNVKYMNSEGCLKNPQNPGPSLWQSSRYYLPEIRRRPTTFQAYSKYIETEPLSKSRPLQSPSSQHRDSPHRAEAVHQARSVSGCLCRRLQSSGL